MHVDRQLLLTSTLLCALLTSGGCATVLTGTSQDVSVTTEPPGAACDLARNGSRLGTVNPTPGSLKVEKTKDAVDIVCRKRGYLDAAARLPSTFQGWTLGNIVIGGLIGVVIDVNTGAANQYQRTIQMNLAPEQFKTAAQRDAFFDTWRSDIGREGEKAKQEISRTCAAAQCQDLLRQADSQVEVALAEIELSRARAKLEQANQQVKVAQQVSPVETPKSTFLNTGDKWKYAINHRGRELGVVTVEIESAAGGKVKERITMDGFTGYQAERTVMEAFSADKFQSTVVLPGGYQMVEIAPYLPPGTAITAGQRWERVPSEVAILGAGKRAFISQAVVVGQENIRVPAGEFQAWRIETLSDKVSYAGTGNTTQVRCTYWYAPDVRRTVKMSLKIDSPIFAAQADDTYEMVAQQAGR